MRNKTKQGMKQILGWRKFRNETKLGGGQIRDETIVGMTLATKSIIILVTNKSN